MPPSSGSTQPPLDPPRPPGPEPPGRRFGGRLWTALAALGILGTVGAYVTNLALESAEERLTEPIAVDVRVTTSSPNFLFSTAVDPQDAPIDADVPTLDSFREWALAQPGIPYGDASFELILRGRDPDTVVVQEIRVRVVDRTAVPADSWVNAWDGCGAALPVRLLTVDLAAEPPRVDLFVDGRLSNGTVFGITRTEVEVFEVEVISGPAVVAYVFEVRYSSAGRDGVVTVDDAGRPFRLAGGGSPAVFATVGDPTRLTRDDDASEALSRGGPLC